jgi:hypothetical protein
MNKQKLAGRRATPHCKFKRQFWMVVSSSVVEATITLKTLLPLDDNNGCDQQQHQQQDQHDESFEDAL